MPYKKSVLPAAEERRRFQRVKVHLLGRYMLPDRREFPCQVLEMSPGDAVVIAPVAGRPQIPEPYPVCQTSTMTESARPTASPKPNSRKRVRLSETPPLRERLKSRLVILAARWSS